MEQRINTESQETPKETHKEMTKETPKKARKGIGMPAVILLSIGLALIVNGIYLGIETACVKAGKKMPYEKVVYGGDCIEYQGFYWHILSLEPASSPEHPAPATEPIRSFSLVMFLLLTGASAFVLWVLLALIDRHFKAVLVVVGGVAIVSLSVFGYKKGREVWKNTPDHLIAVTIITADVHPGVTSAMRLPNETLTLVAPGEEGPYGYLKKEKMENAIDPKTIRGKELKTLIRETKALQEQANTNKEDGFTYFVRVEYAKKKGIGQTHVFGYGDFPEGWSEYIQTVNQICKTDYLREEPVAAHLSGEWFTETYGISEKDLPEGVSVEDFLTSYGLEMKNVCGMDHQWKPFEFRAERVLEEYLLRQDQVGAE